jgi:hypothetical protein
MESTSGINEYHIKEITLCVLHRLCGDKYGGFIVTKRENGNSRSLAEYLQLLDRGGTVNITRYEQRTLALLFIHGSELCGVRSLTRTLQTYHHNDRRRLWRYLELCLASAHYGGKLLVNYFYYLLSGEQRLKNVGADCALGYCFDKFTNYLKIYISLKKRKLYFAHSRANVSLGKLTLALEAFEGGGQFITKTLEHDRLPPYQKLVISFLFLAVSCV